MTRIAPQTCSNPNCTTTSRDRAIAVVVHLPAGIRMMYCSEECLDADTERRNSKNIILERLKAEKDAERNKRKEEMMRLATKICNNRNCTTTGRDTGAQFVLVLHDGRRRTYCCEECMDADATRREQEDRDEADGAEMIARERRRQIRELGYEMGDDDDYRSFELGKAALCYLRHAVWGGRAFPRMWPWNPKTWKPKTKMLDLVRAGALIAAEIDRLNRRVEFMI